jgi:hypothetical protein
MQTHRRRSPVRVALTSKEKDIERIVSTRKTNPIHEQRRVMGSQRRTLERFHKFQKIPWHNTDECHSKQSLLDETKASRLDVDSDSDSELENGKQIIDTKPSVTITTTKVQP